MSILVSPAPTASPRLGRAPLSAPPNTTGLWEGFGSAPFCMSALAALVEAARAAVRHNVVIK